MAGSAHADATLEQLKSAMSVFTGGASDPKAFRNEYRDRALDGIDGNWTIMSIDYTAGPELAGRVARACENAAWKVWEVKRVSKYVFTVSNMRRTDRELRITYMSRSGNTFVEEVDPDQYLRWAGVDAPQLDEELRTRFLEDIGGFAAVFRPAMDVLVIQTNYRMPLVYVRCE